MGKLGTRTRSHAHGQRRGRLTLHVLIMALAVVAVAFASQYPRSTVATTVTNMPSLTYSGVGGSLSMSAGDAQLRPGTSLRTLASVATMTKTAEATSVRASGGVSPAASLTSGVVAAAVSSGVEGAGVTSLADIVDPRKPFHLYTTKPGDTVSGIATDYDIEIGTLLDNNPLVGDENLIEVGQQLLVPLTDAIMHKVASGETVSSIVSQYDNIDAATVVAYRPNGITDPENLEAGSYVALPGATVKPPPPPPPDPDPGPGGGPYTGGGPPASGGLFSSPLLAYLRVSDPFGVPRGAGRIHTGIDLDLAGYWNSPIFAACSGRVSRVEYLTYSYGYHVVIDCGDGWTTLYAHMSRIDVVVGQSVSQGTALGLSGLTGFTTGEHLHFEIRKNGTPLNPRDYIPF